MLHRVCASAVAVSTSVALLAGVLVFEEHSSDCIACSVSPQASYDYFFFLLTLGGREVRGEDESHIVFGVSLSVLLFWPC